MKHIQLPPTRADVVKETLKSSQIVAKECGQKYALVTYDLAIAKIAKRIQCEEFGNVFIAFGFGSFLIEMAFFPSLGKIIEGSGGPQMLSESSVAAMGSMNELLRRKVYNRCRRGHILLSAAIDGLHLEQFFELNNMRAGKR